MLKLYYWVLFLFLINGCASYDKLFIGPGGDMQKCSSAGYGIIGTTLAGYIYDDCAASYRAAGYLDIENAGVIGIALSDDTTLTIIKVYAKSPALYAGIHTGDKIISIDNVPVKSKHDALLLLFGRFGTYVNLRIKSTNETEKDYSLKRASYPEIYGQYESWYVPKESPKDTTAPYDSWTR